MTIRNISEVNGELSTLLAMVESGEEVVIARAGNPIARLTAFERSSQFSEHWARNGKRAVNSDLDMSDPEADQVFLNSPLILIAHPQNAIAESG